jgi:hypothetical protein
MLYSGVNMPGIMMFYKKEKTWAISLFCMVYFNKKPGFRAGNLLVITEK